MTTTASKENSTPSHSSKPFFSKKGEGSFFGQTKEAEQPFFLPRQQPVIQTKLTINEPGDKYEQEADTMADRVMRMSTPVSANGDENLVQSKPLNNITIQRKCAACEGEEKVQRQEMEEEESLQTKPLMRKAAESGGYTASPQLSSQLNSSKGDGDPLPGKTLASMNHAFGADFSTVRIHTGSQAEEMSQGIQAKAFTHGSDIYFNQGQYSPEASEGKRLLGHELTHVVQQTGNVHTKSVSKTPFHEVSFSIIQRKDALSGSDLIPPDQRRMIRMGSQGKEVSYAQERLNAHGATPVLEVDGIFGPLTRQATLDYQNSHGLAVDSIIGPRTWASLDGPTAVGKESGQGKGGSSTPGTGKALKYDNKGYTLIPPGPPTKTNPITTILKTIKAGLQAKQDQTPPELGKTINVKGVAAGTPEEVFVWNAMLQLGTSNRWGSEVDIVTDINWATAGAPPIGQITLRIDPQGNATAELLRTGAVTVSSKFTTLAAAKTDLKTDFNLADIKDGLANWTLAELNKVHAAFSKIPASDRAALAGVDLVREHILIDKKGDPLSGLFSNSAQIAQGATKATRSDTLSLADLAFAHDDISFIGDKGNAEVASFQTILHEAGHAVETKALRDAQFVTMEATGANNQTITTLNAKIVILNRAVADSNSATQVAFAKVNRYNPADKKAVQSFLRAVDAATTAINAYGNNKKVDQHSKLETTASTAISKRDTEQSKLSTASAKHPALTDFADTIKRQNDWFKAAQDRAQAHTAQKATEDNLTERKKQEKAVSGAANQSKRLKNFVDVVNKNSIPPLTDYAKLNWPSHPEEFFAEAYSLWLSDRTYIEANAKPLLDWFDQGEHLK